MNEKERLKEVIEKALDNGFAKHTPLTCGFLAEALYNEGYRKQIEGEWVVKFRSTFPQYEPSEYECSICRYKGTVLHKYCPNCGARMKGD